MKARWLAAVLSFLLVFSNAAIFAVAAVPESNWADQITASDKQWYGDGSAQSFTISNARELAYLAVLVSGGTNAFAGKTVVLDSDIDLSGHLWAPIGNNSKFFQGMLEGNGHTVSGMTIHTASSEQQALIGVISNSQSNFVAGVKNLRLTGCNVTTTGTEKPALLVGQIYIPTSQASVTVENIYAQGELSASRSGSTVRPGGICSMVSNSGVGTVLFKNIVADVDITAATASTAHVGGIVGNVNSNVGMLHFENCISLGDLRGVTNVGGIVGFAGGAAVQTVQNCANTGALSGKTVGDIIGKPDGGAGYAVKDCVFASKLSAQTVSDINAVFNGAWDALLTLDSYMEAEAVIRSACSAAEAISMQDGLFAVQLSDKTSGKFNARFLGKVEQLAGKSEVGFDIIIDGSAQAYATAVVYESIIASDALGIGQTVTAAQLQTVGMYAVTVCNIPADSEVTVLVTPYYKRAQDGAKISGETRACRFSAGKYAPEAVTDAQKEIPQYATASGTAADFALAYGQKQRTVTGTTAAEFEVYCKSLTDAGYTLYLSNEIGNNLYRTYVLANTVKLHTYYIAKQNKVRIVVGEIDSSGLVAASDTSGAKVTETALTQMGLYYGDNNNGKGMGYVITLEDGRFVVIDGGDYYEGQNADRLYDLMTSLNKRQDGIVIAAWILTHEHGDHYGGFKTFLPKYASQVTIENMYVNVPSVAQRKNAALGDDLVSGDAQNGYFIANAFVELTQSYGDIPVTVLHTGQAFSISNARFEVLFTTEDLLPEKPALFNDVSMVFRVDLGKGEDSRVLFLGDIDSHASGVILGMYEAADLQTNGVQVSHHGANGATKAFYQAVAPKLVLWPSSQQAYMNRVNSYAANQYLASIPGVKILVADATAPENHISFTAAGAPQYSKRSMS